MRIPAPSFFYGIDENNADPAMLSVTLDAPVDRAVMQRAIAGAMTRYPYFAVRLVVENESLWLESNVKPVLLYDGFSLLPEDNNEHVIRFIVKDNVLLLVIAHAISDMQGGMYPLMRTVLWLYYSELEGHEIRMDGVRRPGEEVPASELVDPLTMVPAGVTPSDFAPARPAFLLPEYVKEKCDGTRYVYRFSVRQEELMAVARKNGGSPNSVIATLLCRVIDRLCDIPPQKALTAGVAINTGNILGCPDSFYDFVNQLFIEYTDELRAMDFGSAQGAFRAEIKRLSTYEVVAAKQTRLVQFDAYIRSQSTLAAKQAIARRAMDMAAGTATFVVSYAGRSDFGEASPHIRHIDIFGIPPVLMVEIGCSPEYFDIDFIQAFDSDIYVNGLRKELAALSIESLEREHFTVPVISCRKPR